MDEDKSLTPLRIRSTRFTNWIRNPWTNFAFGIVGVFGVLFTVYGWWDGREFPGLTVFVSPSRSIVLKQGESTDLKVFHNGKAVVGDLSAVRIYVWNDGKRAIRSEDILKPFIISTSRDAHIIEAKIEKEGRDVTNAKINQADLENGQVRLDWRILEKDDGVILRVLYVGERRAKFSASGAFVHQAGPRELSPEVDEESPRLGRKYPMLGLVTGLIGLVVMSSTGIWMIYSTRKTFSDATAPFGAKVLIVLVSFAYFWGAYFMAKMAMKMANLPPWYFG